MAHSDRRNRNSVGSSISTVSSIKQRITTIPGRCINPAKLENMLKARFGDDYDVEVSFNSDSILEYK